MSILANVKKTYYYARKNGVMEAYYAVKERAYAKKSPMYLGNGYHFEEITKEECERQKIAIKEFQEQPKISILVPTYETKPNFLKEMIDSVMNQTYGNWELILADASETSIVYDEVKSYVEYINVKYIDCTADNQDLMGAVAESCESDKCVTHQGEIVYIKLLENKGISENTNVALEYATGEYIGLLDHDDFLTQNALFEMVKAINENGKNGDKIGFLYSDEDKCDTDGNNYYDPNIKLGFNFDYLLSNNYICHFLVMRSDLMKSLRFRAKYDGAQDFDIILRAAIRCMLVDKAQMIHVNRVLYHWRCHDGSTAANPMSKMYAYEAGRCVVESGLKQYLSLLGNVVQENNSELTVENQYNDKRLLKHTDELNKGFYVNGILVKVLHTKHNGFYSIQYGKNTAREMFLVRSDVAVIAFPILNNNKITSGIYDETGESLYDNIPRKVSGYLHRAVLQQEVFAAEKGHVYIRDEYSDLAAKQSVSNHDLTNEKCSFIVYNPYICH